MQWFAQNWVWVLFFVGFIAMHMFGHGGHGSHGGHGGHGAESSADQSVKPVSKDSAQRPSEQPPEHRH